MYVASVSSLSEDMLALSDCLTYEHQVEGVDRASLLNMPTDEIRWSTLRSAYETFCGREPLKHWSQRQYFFWQYFSQPEKFKGLEAHN